jgi:hypothetical protein
MAIAALNRDTNKILFLRNKFLKKLSLRMSRGLTKYDDQRSSRENITVKSAVKGQRGLYS